MNKVEINAEEVPLPAWADEAAAYCRSVMESLRLSGQVLSVLFCGSRFMRQLNQQFRGQDTPTDVLSFPYAALAGEKSGAFVPAGDIVISLEEMKANARSAGVPAAEELRRLLIHGILHLAGYDHAGNGADEPMLIQQERLLKELPSWTAAV